METSAALIVAQVLGPLYVIAALGLFTRPERFASLVTELNAKPGLTVGWGLSVLALGLLILAVHNVWRADWTVVVTLIGWAAAIKGAILTLAPEMVMGLGRKLSSPPSKLRVWAAAPLALGVFLTAMGYGS